MATKNIPLIVPLGKAFSESAREAAAEARRGKGKHADDKEGSGKKHDPDMPYSKEKHDEWVEAATTEAMKYVEEGGAFKTGPDEIEYTIAVEENVEAAEEAGEEVKVGDYIEHDWNDTGSISVLSKEEFQSAVKEEIDRSVKAHGDGKWKPKDARTWG